MTNEHERHQASVTVRIFSCGMMADQPCSGNQHYFTEKPGRCQCGREFWEDDKPEPHLRLV